MDDASLMFVGRLLLGGLFVSGGIRHAFVYPAVIPMMRARGVPMAPVVLAAGSVFQVVAGLCFIAGAWLFASSLGLAAFTLAASIMLLDFWNKSGPERDALMNAALCNVAIIGGLLIAAATAV